MIGLLAVLAFQPAAADPEWRYTTVPGDTVERVCRIHTGSAANAKALAELNSLNPDAPIPPGTTVRIPAAWLPDMPIVGGVLRMSGDASYRAFGTSDYRPLVAQEPVYLGDTIRTGEGTAELEFTSGLIINLKPNSEVTLDSLGGTSEKPSVGIVIEHGQVATEASEI